MDYEKEIEQLKEKTGNLIKANRLMRICNVGFCLALIAHIIANMIA